ncbi:hypothetical protein ACFFU9_13830 [Mariniflexile ostreae]|uniref:DUF1735 domain-containing protein n=1 Tax=Mariniflexile ostreae TaxID=1520892 RepID=A0ABV5FEC2_9FLAO
MKKLLLFINAFAIIFFGCAEDTFSDGVIPNSPKAPEGLKYASVVNAREFGVLISAPPTYSSFGAIPFFEIVAVRDENGTALEQSLVDQYFSILNATEGIVTVPVENEPNQQFPSIDTDNIGQIQIENDNPFVLGSYFFDIRMTTIFDGKAFQSTFQNVFELNMGPELAAGLIYIPGGQNLLTSGGSSTTTEPLVFGANPDFRYELADNQDKFSIDASTGAITLNSGYSPSAEPEIVSPTINIISNVTEEVVSFTDAISIYISNSPVNIPKLSVQVFYPTFEFENTSYGYKIHTVLEGDSGVFWGRVGADGLVGENRPTENANQKRLVVNLVQPSGGAQAAHESWAIMNSQDLSAYELGFDVKAEFYTKNRFVEYKNDGTSPSFLKTYVSVDYMGDFDKATWTEVTNQLISNIESNGAFVDGNEFNGFPYPGDQQLNGLINPDGQKDSSKNSDNLYTKSILNLADYAGMTNVTIAFRVKTNFVAPLAYTGGFGRSGQWWLSDFNIVANEQ